MTIRTDPAPCRELSCDMEKEPVESCSKRGCGFRWVREAAEDRKAREEKDRSRMRHERRTV